MEFHPYAESFPMLNGKKYEEFRADIASSDGPRQPIKYRLINGGTKQGLDGRNRVRACNDLELPCPEERVQVSDEDVEAYIDSLNLHRRHLTPEEQAEERAARVKRVAELRAQGKSYRQIADTEGISQTQAKRDSETSDTPGVTPVTPDAKDTEEPPKVTGKDGKTYPATKPKKEPILCNACQRKKRVGQALPKGCQDCKELRPKKPKKPKEPPKPDPKYAGLPKSVANALSDTWHAESARILSKIRTECKSAFSWSTFLDASILDHLKIAEDLFITAIPRKPCPDCKGQKKVDGEACKRCRQGGYLTSHAGD